jgi:hypothetical protein
MAINENPGGGPSTAEVRSRCSREEHSEHTQACGRMQALIAEFSFKSWLGRLQVDDPEFRILPPWEPDDLTPTGVRLRLRANGFWPVPQKGKEPNLVGWQNTRADDDTIRNWERHRSWETNTGLQTRDSPAIDVDIMHAEAAEAAEALIRERFGARGCILIRVGMAPKRAVLMRAGAPFGKIKKAFTASDGSKHKIEILGDGQQLVVHGIHPDTKRPYTWTGGEPWTVDRSELPEITEAEARAFLDEASELLTEQFGFGSAADKETDDKNPFLEHAEQVLGAPNWDKPISNILSGEDLHDSTRDLAAMKIAAGTEPGAVVNEIRALMNLSKAERDARFQDRFDDIPRLVESAEKKFAKPAETVKTKLLQSSAEFVGGYVPPDYLVDGLLQRRYIYSFTGPTGSGKTAIVLRLAAHVALGLPLGGREVEKGRVLFFAGENPDDVRSRLVALCEQMKVDPNTIDVVFMPFTPQLSEAKIRHQIDAEAAEYGPFSLLIVDTSAAYFSGDNENDNVELGNHARMLRTFVNLPGGPTVLVTCHPTKTADMSNLQPRGGGAFINEIDGNLVCIKNRDSMVAEVTTHGKFRGPEFSPFSFKLVSTTSERLVDTKGRRIWTVFAEPLTDQERAAIEREGQSDQDAVLRVMLDWPGASLSEMAGRLFWGGNDGKPHKSKVHRVLQELGKHKLVKQQRDGTYALTDRGQEEAEKTAPIRSVGG